MAMWWPLFMALAIVVLGIAFFLIFRAPVSNLLDRIRSISKAGISVAAPQKTAPAERDPRLEAEQLIRELDSALIREAEEAIQKDLEARNLSGEDSARVLRRYLAASWIGHAFEYIYRIIWGSQLSLLNYLNEQNLGEPVEAIRPFYTLAASQFPTWYTNYSFEQWLGFLKESVLVRQDDGMIRITVRGREFLAHLIRMGYTMNKAG
jgi:hypothetical protein